MPTTLKLSLTLLICCILTVNAFAQQQLRVEHFVRIKGQEETVIRQYGIVSGLNGTGDDVRNYTPTTHAILQQMSRSGLQVPGLDARGLGSARSNALVEVIVTIPGTGARSGEMLDCTVVAIGGASSLAGGVLSPTLLTTPFQQDENSLPQGMASGKITLEQAASPSVGRIVNGCRLTADFMHQYIENGLLTLVIRREHAHHNMANRIAEAINNNVELQALSMEPPARAINAHSVIVRMPTNYFANPMEFVAQVMDAEVLGGVPARVPRVIINERAGSIAIDADVEVRPTLVTHRNFIADIPPAEGEEEAPPRQFLDIDTDTRFRQMNGENVNNMKLRALQASLNALRATQAEVIDIIKILHQQGAIVGDVVFVD